MGAGWRAATIVHWLEPLTRETVLDAGCGAGLAAISPVWARPWSASISCPVAPLRGQGTALALRGRSRAIGRAGLTTAILQEARGLSARGARGSGESACRVGARRLILVTRVQSTWGDWADRLSARAADHRSTR